MAVAAGSLVQTETTLAANPAEVALTGPISLVHHSLVTKDYELLMFHAAAALQLQFGHQRHEKAATSDNRLIASPYNDELHLLDLRRLDTPNQLLAKALTILKPIREDYATAPFIESFNWQLVIDFLRDLAAAEGYQWKKRKFYVVTFRSKLYPDIDLQRLHDLDAHSHQEAVASGGLLKYWFGTQNQSRQNLATCLWRSREDARAGGTGPRHKNARAAAREMYDTIVFTTLKLDIDDGASSWQISDWTNEDV
ncbi:hypothetical protein POJ06DRAFT_277296 [Lipomyces tetrasporus]|uniref:Uncharacterized protein n=1 Tax=Lipomyces tetrasporus TaxID=54092 RepID=A0AAD7VS97_9ASCO|nr:uncharacterized protein POJ06DRAFT_277296 [Lipomyces tetrasporus]KAJ8098905.1 hypothetical protein POJ06DRAFT_277296 [Lipomyces tetrasporus]